jgi:hypothetical protein
MTRLLWLLLVLLFFVVLGGCVHTPTVMAPHFEAQTLYVCRATGDNSIQCTKFVDFMAAWEAAQASREEKL